MEAVLKRVLESGINLRINLLIEGILNLISEVLCRSQILVDRIVENF